MSVSTEDTATANVEAARRAWAAGLRTEWERRGAREEDYTHGSVEPPPPAAAANPGFRAASYSHPMMPDAAHPYNQRYRPASHEDSTANVAHGHAEDMRRPYELQEEIKYHERQALTMSTSNMAPLLRWDVGSQVLSVAVSHDGSRIISGSLDGLVRIWDARTGSLVLGPLRGHICRVRSVAWWHDDSLVVSGSDGGAVRTWDSRTGALITETISCGDRESGMASLGEISVAISADSTRIVSGMYGGAIRMWETRAGSSKIDLVQGHTHTVRSVAFSPVNTRIVSGSDDYTISIWDARTGAPIGEPLRGHTHAVLSAAFSPNNALIISGSVDETIRIWNAHTGAPMGEPLRGHNDAVLSVAFSLDSNYIVSGSEDKTIRIWDAFTHAPIGEPLRGHTNVIQSVAFSPDTTRIITGSPDQTICVWETPGYTPSFDMVTSNMSAQEMFDLLVRHGCRSLASYINAKNTVSKVIASGGFGDVRRMVTNDGNPVAVKTLRLHIWERDDDKAVKRAVREVHMWSRLRHVNVQELLGIILLQNGLGMVSPWREKGHLQQYIQAHPDAERYSLCMQLASGVSYLHGIGMVHGDLKATNVLVSDDSTLKINDFDYAMFPETSLQFSTTTRLGGGTLRWMAPELLQEEDDMTNARTLTARDKRTDVYALGMTMLETFSGTVPYAEFRNDMGVYRAIDRRQPPRRPVKLSKADSRAGQMWELLLQCWDHQPSARPEASSVLTTLQSLIP